MNAREKLVEAMARAAWDHAKITGEPWGEVRPGIKRLWLLDAEIALSAITAAGYAVVPVEATGKMLVDAGPMDDWDGNPDDADRCHAEWWSAMLAAGRVDGGPGK